MSGEPHRAGGYGKTVSIFVSIAAYRDPELVPTIEHCLSNAKSPDQIHFGLCWQHGEDEKLPSSIMNDPRMRIRDVDWRQSKGACWARAQIMDLWDGEDYYLQIDSHHRFAKHWDAKLIRFARLTKSPKPVLTAYCPPYEPGDETNRSNAPMKMDFDYFTEDGIAMFKPAMLNNGEIARQPIPARFLSGHFLFAPGSFVEEVPYDPDLYFHGEEITLAIRAYTWGYDLFHPHRTLLWHEYTRDYRRKHWDDHVVAGAVERPWHERDGESKNHVRRFLSDPYQGRFACGPARTFDQYCAYAGINFRQRRVQDYTRLGLAPPNPPAAESWACEIQTWKVVIELKRSQMSAEALVNSPFWYVGFHDANDVEIYREDLCGNEMCAVIHEAGEYLRIEREFQSGAVPRTWTIWPMAQSMNWLEKTVGDTGFQ